MEEGHSLVPVDREGHHTLWVLASAAAHKLAGHKAPAHIPVVGHIVGHSLAASVALVVHTLPAQITPWNTDSSKHTHIISITYVDVNSDFFFRQEKWS